jgi:hypothetical protein
MKSGTVCTHTEKEREREREIEKCTITIKITTNNRKLALEITARTEKFHECLQFYQKILMPTPYRHTEKA